MGPRSWPPTQQEWSFRPESTPENTITLENAYYDAESLQDRGDLAGAAEAYERLVALEQPCAGSEWGLRARKQLVLIYVNRGEFEKSLWMYERLLQYLDAAVPRTLVEQTIGELLDYLASSETTPTAALERFFTSTLTALAETGVPANDRLWFRTKVRLGHVYLETGSFWKLSLLLRDLYRRLGVAVDDEETVLPSSLSQQRTSLPELTEDEPMNDFSSTQLLELFALDMQLQLALGDDFAAMPCLLQEVIEPRPFRSSSVSPSSPSGTTRRDWSPPTAIASAASDAPESHPSRGTSPGAPTITGDVPLNSRLRRLYRQAMRIKWVLPGSRTMATIRACGGKMYMVDGRFADAAREFFEAFRHYEEVGAPQRVGALRYVVFANLLSGNTVNLFDAPELQAYRAEPCVRAMTDLIDAYQRNDLAKFENSLERDEGILEDAFLRPYVEMLSNRLWQRAVQRAIQPYRTISLASLAERLGARGSLKAIEQVEQALIQLMIDGYILGCIDQKRGILELSWKRATFETPASGQLEAISSNEQTGARSVVSSARMIDESLVNPTRYAIPSYPVHAVELQGWQSADPDADRVDALLTLWAQRLGRVRSQLTRLARDVY